MSEWNPTAGIKFSNRYLEAQNKLMEFERAFDDLTPAERERLTREVMASKGMAAVFAQFVGCMHARYMNGGNGSPCR